MGNKCFGKSKSQQKLDNDQQTLDSNHKRNSKKSLQGAMKIEEHIQQESPDQKPVSMEPSPVLEIERKGSGRKQSIKGMSHVM